MSGAGEVVPAIAVDSSLPPAPPFTPVSSASDGEPVVRFPGVEAGVRDLLERRLLTRPEFDELALEARRAAFTVARAANLDAIERANRLLVQDVARGGTLEEFRQRIDETLGESALNPRHLENVYRTNVAAAYTAGLVEILGHPLVADEFPYLEYHAVHDSRARPEHREMESLGIQGTNVYRRDDPVWQTFLPPWDYQCRCAVIPLSLEDAAGKGIREAQQWLESGAPPVQPAWVSRPPFEPSPGFAGPSPSGRFRGV